MFEPVLYENDQYIISRLFKPRGDRLCYSLETKTGRLFQADTLERVMNAYRATKIRIVPEKEKEPRILI